MVMALVTGTMAMGTAADLGMLAAPASRVPAVLAMTGRSRVRMLDATAGPRVLVAGSSVLAALGA